MQRDDYRAAMTVMFGLTAANLTGFLRQTAIAHQLGAGRAADIYLVAFAVPEFVFIALPIVLSPAFIPLFTGCRLRAGEASAWRFGMRAAGVLLASLLALAAIAGLAAPLYLVWLSPGFGLHERDQAVRALYLMLPSIGLMGLVTLVGAALQVYRRFVLPALATTVYNLVFIVTLLAAPLAWSVGRAAWGVTLGAAASLAIQLPVLWGHRPSSPWPSATGEERGGVGQLARLAGPLAAGHVVHHVILFVDRSMATALGAGSAAALYYAYHLALVVAQLSGLAVSTALFPRMAEQVNRGNMSGARDSLANALRLVWMLALPASAGLIVLRTPVVQVLFERGAFDPAATAAVSAPLVWYALAVLADALCLTLWRMVYAQRNMWTVLTVNSLQTGLRLLCNLALIPVFGYNGLSLSAALGLSVQAIVLGWLVWRRLGNYLTSAWWLDAARVVLATAIAIGVTGWAVAQLHTSPVVILLTGGTLGGLVYFITLRCIKYQMRPLAR